MRRAYKQPQQEKNCMKIPINVEEMMDNNIVTLNGDTSVTDAMEEMHGAGVWSVVVTMDGEPQGVVTERDLLRRCFRSKQDPDRVQLREIMSFPLVTVDRNVSIGSALNLLLVDEIRRVYVVNDEGEIFGRVTQTGCLESTLSFFLSLQSISEQI